MLQKNELWVGLVVGLILPAAFFILLINIFDLLEQGGGASGVGFSGNFRERTAALVAIAANILPLRVYRRRRWEESMRGIVTATGIWALVWLFRYGVTLF